MIDRDTDPARDEFWTKTDTPSPAARAALEAFKRVAAAERRLAKERAVLELTIITRPMTEGDREWYYVESVKIEQNEEERDGSVEERRLDKIRDAVAWKYRK